MLRKGIIRNLLAGLMLILFALSIMPKKTLHDLIANHKDTPFKSNSSKALQFNLSGFSCKCDNLVVESPFIIDIAPVEIAISPANLLQFSEITNNFNFGHHFYIELRGPPFNA